MSTSDKIVNAARAYRDAYAREHAPGAIPTGEAKQFERELLAMCRDMVDPSDADDGLIRAPTAPQNACATPRRPWPDPSGYVDLCRIQFGEDDPRVPVPSAVAAVRPWPDPETYKALAREVYGQSDLPRDVPSAVAGWKALQDGQRVMCARGYQWTADRTGGRLRFTMAKQDGRPGKTLEQPWYPCIVGKLPVWPIVIVAAESVG